MSGKTEPYNGTGPGPSPGDYIYPTADDYLYEFPAQMQEAMERIARHSHPLVEKWIEQLAQHVDEMMEVFVTIDKRYYAVVGSAIVEQKKVKGADPGFELDVRVPTRTVVQVVARGAKSERCFCYYNKTTKKWVIVQVEPSVAKLAPLPSTPASGASGESTGEKNALTAKQWEERIADAKTYADKVGAAENKTVGLSLFDTENNNYIGGFRDGKTGTAVKPKIASMIKAFYLGAFLKKKGIPSGQNRIDAENMIKSSSDGASSDILAAVGRSEVEDYVKNDLGWGGFYLPSSPGILRVSAYEVGQAFVKMWDTLSAEKRAYARELLSGITSSQRWGIIASAQKSPAWDWWVKGGWLGDSSNGPASVSQVAMIDHPNANQRMVLCITQAWSSGGPSEADVDKNTAAGVKAEKTLENIADIIMGKGGTLRATTAKPADTDEPEKPDESTGSDVVSSIPTGMFRIVYYTWDKHPERLDFDR
jgi:hypothetical protein